MSPIWVVWIHWRASLWEDMSPEEDAAVDAHTGYWRALHAEGRVVLAGAVQAPPTGLAFFYADTRGS